MRHAFEKGCCLILPAFGAISCARPEKPNILLILADDYGPMDTGISGSSFYETPNIDRIASDGVIFTDGYASCTVSSPSRASLMTGVYPTKHGITDWIGALTGEQWRETGWGNRLLPSEYVRNLDTERFLCLPQALKDAGYSTFMAGKWHLGNETTPEMAGFDINMGGYSAGQPVNGYFSPYNNPKLPDGPEGEELSMRLAEETNRFIEENARKGEGKPFFAFLSFYAVHTPVQTTEENWRYFRDKAEANPVTDREPFAVDRNFPVCQIQDNPVFAGLIRQMDDAVGSVLSKLKELGVDKNTIVIFLSDNGGLASLGFYSTSNYPFRGGKSYQWEGGIRVPFYIFDPGASANGTMCGYPVCTMDIYSTLLDYAGVKLPDYVDGVSLRPLLKGKNLPSRPLYWHYPHYGGSGGDPSSTIRMGKWKLIYYHEDLHCELYDLESDPMERSDVSLQNPGIVQPMKERLLSWLEETDALMPAEDPQYDSLRHQEILDSLRKSILEEQMNNRAMRLRSDWVPDSTWWGSKPVFD